ncbi:MAG: hypothetical protein RLZZ09_1105 [Pseudomonadota bacterium]|jgi:hypothetical protein
MSLQKTISELELERAHNRVLLEKLKEIIDQRIVREEDLKRMLDDEFAERDRALERMVTGNYIEPAAAVVEAPAEA